MVNPEGLGPSTTVVVMTDEGGKLLTCCLTIGPLETFAGNKCCHSEAIFVETSLFQHYVIYVKHPACTREKVFCINGVYFDQVKFSSIILNNKPLSTKITAPPLKV